MLLKIGGFHAFIHLHFIHQLNLNLVQNFDVCVKEKIWIWSQLNTEGEIAFWPDIRAYNYVVCVSKHDCLEEFFIPQNVFSQEEFLCDHPLHIKITLLLALHCGFQTKANLVKLRLIQSALTFKVTKNWCFSRKSLYTCYRSNLISG